MNVISEKNHHSEEKTMKELKKRCRGLFVLLLAATFFLQGGWFMPSEAESSNEYLIILQNGFGDVEGQAQGDPYWSAKNYGVYQGTAGSIAAKITAGAIKKASAGSDLQGVADLDKLTSISSIQEPEGATVYILGNTYSGMHFDVKDADGNFIPLYNKEAGSTNIIDWSGQDSNTYGHTFYKIDKVRKVTLADLRMEPRVKQGVAQSYNYKINSSDWITTDKLKTTSILNDTGETHGMASFAGSETGYDLVLDLYKPSIEYTVSDVNVGYDEKPHGITVNVTEPSSDYEIKYGTSEGDITKTESPTFTEPGEYTVYYKIEASGFDTVVGSAKVVIKNDAPIQYTVTYVLDGGKLDGQTGTVTKKVDAGTVITLPAPTKDGFTFDYWEGSKYNAGDKYTVNEDHTFKAVWKAADSGDNDNKSKSSGADDEDGSESSSGKKGVKTGDENNLGFWIFLMSAALIGFAGMAFSTIKRR